MSERVYIHEQVDIVGNNRARYLDYMCQFAPTSREERGMRLFGIWGALGSTTRWPRAVNLWEAAGWEGMARNFAHETGQGGMHDPSLQKWIAEAPQMRSGGFDRILVSADFMPQLDALIADPAILACKAYHHETYAVAPGQALTLLDAMQDRLVPLMQGLGVRLAGAFRTAMRQDAEVIAIWAVPDWDRWAALQAALDGAAGAAWGGSTRSLVSAYEAHTLLPGPRSPLKTGVIL